MRLSMHINKRDITHNTHKIMCTHAEENFCRFTLLFRDKKSLNYVKEKMSFTKHGSHILSNFKTLEFYRKQNKYIYKNKIKPTLGSVL